MTPNTVQPITDEQLAEIERFLGFGGSMLKTKSDAWRGVIARLRAAEKDQARLQFIIDKGALLIPTAFHDSEREAIDAAMHKG